MNPATDITLTQMSVCMKISLQRFSYQVQDRAEINSAPTAFSHGSFVGEGVMPSRSTYCRGKARGG